MFLVAFRSYRCQYYVKFKIELRNAFMILMIINFKRIWTANNAELQYKFSER